MSLTLSSLAGAGWQFFDNAGTPLSGGLLYVYLAGTTTPATTYTTSAGTIQNSNPIVLDSTGRVSDEIWVDYSSEYKFVLKTSAGVQIWSKDNVPGVVNSAAIVSAPFTYNATGAQSRTIQSKLQDAVSFADFGADPSGVADSTTQMQAAIDYVASLGGGNVTGPQGAVYKISSSLKLKTGVQIDLCGATVRQYTNNTAIFTAPSNTSIQTWALKNGTLKFNTQQTNAQTNGVGVLLANGSFSYNFNIEKLIVSNACDGIQCPNTTGSYAFVAEIRDFIGNDCARYSINIDCDSAVGANTNLVFVNCWALQTQGAEQPGSMGFRFNACSMCQWQSLYADHIQGQFLFVQTSSGWFGVLTVESANYEVAPNQLTSVIQFSDVSADINVMKFVVNDFKTYNQFVANVTGTIAVGATITGATSGATGTVRTTGSGAGTTITYYMTNGINFTAGENILVSAVSQGTVTTATDQTGNIYLFRSTSSTYNVSFQQTISQYVTNGNTYLGQNIYDVVPTSNVPATSGPTWIYNWWAQTDRAVQLADFSATKSIRYWNGDNRYYTTGMMADNYSATFGTGSWNFTNPSSSAYAKDLVGTTTPYGASQAGGITMRSWTGSAFAWPTKIQLRSDAGGSPRLSIVGPDAAAAKIEVVTADGSAVETVRGTLSDGNGNFIWGTAALATSATNGFPWIPSCPGAPSGAPTAPYTNAAAMVVDTTNNRLYIRVGSAWKYAALV